MTDSVSGQQQAATEQAHRWIAAMQSMADQLQSQQQTFQHIMQESMNSYLQLLNNPPFSLAGQSQEQQEQQAAQQPFQQVSELARQQQEMFQRMSQQWMEQAQHQQQTFQRMVQESLSTYTNLFRPPA